MSGAVLDGIDRGGVMEFGLGFGGESVGQKFFAEFDVKARVRAGIGAGKLLLGPTAHLQWSSGGRRLPRSCA